MSYLVSINCLISSAMVVTISFIIGSSGTATVEPVWNVKQYFEQKLKMKPTQLSSLESNASEELMTPVQFHTKLYLGIFHAKYGIRGKTKRILLSFYLYIFLLTIAASKRQRLAFDVCVCIRCKFF